MHQTMEPQTEEIKGRNLGKIINKMSNQLKRRYLISEEDIGLTSMQQRVLHFILFRSMKRDVYQKDVETEFEIRKSTATGILQLMEKNGLITRESVARDARLKKLVPTKKALALRTCVLKNIQDAEARMTEGISEEELDLCRKVLLQMSCNLSADEKRMTEE